MSTRNEEGSADLPRDLNPMSAHRLEAFSDGVMAVVMTIMAFGLKTPATATVRGLEGRLPAILVYVFSFVLIGIYWNNHHHLLRATQRISAAVMWTNMHLLFWLSLVPFATQWVGSAHQRALPAAVYGIVSLNSAIAYYALVRAILRANVHDQRIMSAVGRDVKGMASPMIYALGVGLAAVSPYLAYVCYFAVSLLWLVPDRRLAVNATP